jgi:NAD(P)H-flavin reductase
MLKGTPYLVQEVRQESEDVRSYVFAFGDSRFDFAPGDFVAVQQSRLGDKTGALTLSTSPTRRAEFEVMLKRTGDFGAAFYDEVQAGDVAVLSRPSGVFRFKSEPTTLCVVARDYTLPAARSLYQFLQDGGWPHRLILLQEITDLKPLFAAELVQSEHFVRQFWYAGDQPLPAGWHAGPLTGEAVLEVLSGQAASFFVVAEGIDAKRYKSELLRVGIDSARVTVERWS